MEKTTYKFTAYVEIYFNSLGRSSRYYEGVDTPTEALDWINELVVAAKCADDSGRLVSFGFFYPKNDK